MTITEKKKFLTKCKKLAKQYNDEIRGFTDNPERAYLPEAKYSYLYKQPLICSKEVSVEIDNSFISVLHKSCGQENVILSCWDNEKPAKYNTDSPDSSFKSLEEFLLECCPNISFLIYKKMKEEIKIVSFSTTDYYSGTDTFDVRYITFEKVYDVLVKYNLI